MDAHEKIHTAFAALERDLPALLERGGDDSAELPEVPEVAGTTMGVAFPPHSQTLTTD